MVEGSLALDGSLRLLKVRLQPSFPASERLKYMEGFTYFVNDWWQTPRLYFLCCNTPISTVRYHICHRPSLITRSVSICPLEWGMEGGHVIV